MMTQLPGPGPTGMTLIGMAMVMLADAGDPLTHVLTNFGGMTAFAMAMWWLHRDGMKTFREEMAAERASCNQRISEERAERRMNHEDITDRLDSVREAIRNLKGAT